MKQTRLSAGRVLVIDAYDERDMYVEVLRFHGLVVTAASTASEGLDLLDRECPDVIVHGLAFPDLSGCELAKRVKAREQTRDTPLIALSGFTDRVHLEEASAAGCDSVLIKPCLPDALLAEVRRLIDISKARNVRGKGTSARSGSLRRKSRGRPGRGSGPPPKTGC